jgi:hypothetical protein
MYREETEQAFAKAGWHIDGGFSDYLVIGYDGNGLSILAYKEALGTDEPIFELIDHERNVTYEVQEILPPSRPRGYSLRTASHQKKRIRKTLEKAPH